MSRYTKDDAFRRIWSQVVMGAAYSVSGGSKTDDRDVSDTIKH